jgi:hypothetical protein
MSNKDTVVAVISDMQVGSTVALCPPKWNLFDGGTHSASPAQMIIYRQWIHAAKQVKDLLNEGRVRKRLVLILNGEPIDNYHHGTPQIITKRPQEQIEMAIALLDEWMQVTGYDPKRGDKMYLVRGTSAHESGEYINQIGRDLDGVVPCRKDTSSITKDGRYYFHKLRRTVNGKYFHVTHHGFGRGTRAWTQENAISYSLKSQYCSCLDQGIPIPDYMVTGHFHVFNEAYYYGKQKPMYGCTSPCWQLKTHFGNRVAALEDINTIGMVSFDVLKSGATKIYPEYIKVEDTPVEEF